MKNSKIHTCLLIASFLINTLPLFSQEITDTTLKKQLDPVTVSASRLVSKDIETPSSVTSISRSAIQSGQPQLAADEALRYVPGLFALNGYNFAQDLRVSIRGFGARSAFGIRGITMLVDGLPETTPDGQAQVDNLDLGIMDKIEVLRGPSSGLYGNAAGGVISYYTEEPSKDFSLETKYIGGSFGFSRFQVKASQQIKKLGYLFSASNTNLDGFRQQSEMKSTLFNGKLLYSFNDNSALKILINYLNSPTANDPGAITEEQAVEDPRQARDVNINFKAGESIKQGKVGVLYDISLNKQNAVHAHAYYVFRDFSNNLPFENGGIVEFDRAFSGIGFYHSIKQNSKNFGFEFQTGIESKLQEDDRQRYNNLQGSKGEKNLDQVERFGSFGIFHLQNWAIGSKIQLRNAFRYESINLEALDDYLMDGNDSGNQKLNSFNPSVGFNYLFSNAFSGFLSYSTSFESPALSELSANPLGTGGFNPALKPQKAVSYEIGIKGRAIQKLKFDLAVFHISVKDEFIPYELEDFPGRTFYRNAGQSSRNGMEVSTQWVIGNRLSAYLQYTFSDFTFKSYQINDNNFDGNLIPGIPKHNGLFELRYFSTFGLIAKYQVQFIGNLMVNDANTAEADDYVLHNFRITYTYSGKKFELEPFFGINNMYNQRYYSNVRINSFGNRYFEPGPDINIFAGLKIRFEK